VLVVLHGLNTFVLVVCVYEWFKLANGNGKCSSISRMHDNVSGGRKKDTCAASRQQNNDKN